MEGNLVVWVGPWSTGFSFDWWGLLVMGCCGDGLEGMKSWSGLKSLPWDVRGGEEAVGTDVSGSGSNLERKKKWELFQNVIYFFGSKEKWLKESRLKVQKEKFAWNVVGEKSIQNCKKIRKVTNYLRWSEDGSGLCCCSDCFRCSGNCGCGGCSARWCWDWRECVLSCSLSRCQMKWRGFCPRGDECLWTWTCCRRSEKGWQGWRTFGILRSESVTKCKFKLRPQVARW